MRTSPSKKLQQKNTIYWVTAMLIPALMDLGLKALATGPVKFPWVIVIPPLFLALLVGSNRLIDEAAAATDHPEEILD